MKKFLRDVFSIKNEKQHKVIKLCGMKLKVKSKYNRLILNIYELKERQQKLLNENKKFSAKLAHLQQQMNRFNFVLNRGINKEKLSYEIEKFTQRGVREEERTHPRLIVSLTSYPERMYDLHFCLYSLLNQTLKPDMVILWLAREEFPNGENDISKKVLNLKKNGLTIKWCKNIRSYKKLIPALEEYPQDIIVTADDDIFYPQNWLEKLYTSYIKNPQNIHCHRAHKITFDKNSRIEPYQNWRKCIDDKTLSFNNFSTTGGGVLYPPKCLYKDVLNEDYFTKLAPEADDIWFWAMAVMNNTKIRVIENPFNQIVYTNPAREQRIYDETTLYSKNCAGGNDEQLKAVLAQYPQIKDKLRDYHYVFEMYNDNIYSYILFLDHKFAYEYAKQYVNKNSTVLEIGCGDGYGTDYLSKYCERIEAVDVSKDAIKKAAAMYSSQNCAFNYYDGVNLTYPDKSFDVVISFHVIEHVEDVRLFLNNIKRVLKEDGKFIITTPSRTHRLAPNQKPWNKEHLREYDAAMLESEISQVFEYYQIMSVTAKQDILDIEFDRVAPNRADFNGIRKNINTNIDYKSFYTTGDFFVSAKNLDEGIDLMVTGSKFDSQKYWSKRYETNGNSGAGSYGRLAEFKAEIINSFVNKNNINSVIEFGCGDGNNLLLFDFKEYLGFDISDKAIEQCKKMAFPSDYQFKLLKEYNNDKAELVLSLDVIYHLIEDKLFESYMQKLFESAQKYVIIYSSNKNETHCLHVKHRKFTDWIKNNAQNWHCSKHIPNKYPYDPNNPNTTSFSDFYVFEKQQKS